MTQPVADAANIAPRNSGAKRLRIVLQPDRRFADDEHLAFNRSLSLLVLPVSVNIHAENELLDALDAFNDIGKMRFQVVKRHEWPRARHARAQPPSLAPPGRGRHSRPADRSGD